MITMTHINESCMMTDECFGVTWYHRSCDRSTRHLLVVLWNQASISNSFPDIQWQMW